MVSHRNSFEEVTRTYSAGTRFLHINIFTQIWLYSDSYRVIIHTDVSETKLKFPTEYTLSRKLSKLAYSRLTASGCQT